MVASVEEVSSSLVREYLSRKGLKRTIACMDAEHPRTETSINNRSELRQMLNAEDLYKKNKVQISPLKTLLEVIVKYHMEHQKKPKITRSESEFVLSLSSSANSTAETSAKKSTKDDVRATFENDKYTDLRSEAKGTCLSEAADLPLSDGDRLCSVNQVNADNFDSEQTKGHSRTVLRQASENSAFKDSEKKNPANETTTRSRNNRVRRGMMSGPIPLESSKKRHNSKFEVSQPLFRREGENKHSVDGHIQTHAYQRDLERSRVDVSENSCADVKHGLPSSPERLWRESSDERRGQNQEKTIRMNPKSGVSNLKLSEMILDDVDDEDLQEISHVSVQNTVSEWHPVGCPMDQNTAVELKVILLGSSLNCFTTEWRNQGFTFSENHDLRYGIVQRKGGPCGVLASVQAFVLKKLLFETSEKSPSDLQRLKPSSTTRRRCLVQALAEVLWRAGEEKQATVAVNSGNDHFSPCGRYRSEGVFEKITFFTTDNFKDLQLILEQHIAQFETGVLGCILLTISAVLSRSIEKVRTDMDVSTSTLIAAHGYCTQELVNLLLCGRAVSNVFDNDMELDTGSGNITLLKGIKTCCDVGFLSLYEHYNICKVGAYLKTPSYPIWVVCSESHFSVLFGLQRELLTCQERGLEFDLYYYDGLANQQEEIRLTLTVGKHDQGAQEEDSADNPPLELCIRTRWKDAAINWNDTEPIL